MQCIRTENNYIQKTYKYSAETKKSALNSHVQLPPPPSPRPKKKLSINELIISIFDPSFSPNCLNSLLAYCFTLHSLRFDMQHDYLQKTVFDLLSSPQGSISRARTNYSICLLVVLGFNTVKSVS